MGISDKAWELAFEAINKWTEEKKPVLIRSGLTASLAILIDKILDCPSVKVGSFGILQMGERVCENRQKQTRNRH